MLTIGSDHPIVLLLLRAASKRAKESVALLHFDAHLDTEGIYHVDTRGPLYDKKGG